MKPKFLLPLLILAFFAGCKGKQESEQKDTASMVADQELLTKAQGFFKALPAIAENPDNPITDAKVKLGRQLYFDVNLSKDKTQSCNTCHNLSTFGVDNLPVSKGDAGKDGTRNSQTVYNVALHSMMFWDGRAKDVEEQAGMPILNPVEMNIPNEAFLVKRLKAIPAYVTMFKEAFSDDKDPVTFANLKKAIAAFERTLIVPSKFDTYINGDMTALNDAEKKGLATFMEVNCTMCHIGDNFGGNMFQKFGLHGNYWDYTKSAVIDNGRFDVTKSDADKYIFKVPGLRFVEKTTPYFHDGSVKELAEAVKIMGKVGLNKDLTDEQIKDIVTFLSTLTGVIPEEMQKAPAPVL